MAEEIVQGERCENCRYWGHMGGLDIDHCKRYAPTLIEMRSVSYFRTEKTMKDTQDMFGDDEKEMGFWPFTEFDDWCGEWKPKPEEK